jgi:prepilin-type N-terminal cleavage/methylation domain-containing protein
MVKIRKAFTMLELIFVIVIMGIVGKFGVELLFQAYNYYLFNTAENRFQGQSEAAVEQIANRLQYRIPGSEVVRQGNASPIAAYTSIATAVNNGSPITVLEWVGYDIDGWRGDGSSTDPTWSGFIDLSASQAQANTVLVTPGSNVTRISNTFTALSPSGFSGVKAGLFFIQDSNFNVQDGFGWNGVAITDQNVTTHPVDVGVNQLVANGGNFGGRNMYEFYKLSWTAYALELTIDPVTGTGPLRLYYDYRPWNGQRYTDGSSVVLMENVDTFRFRSAGDAIKVQVCIRDAKLFNNNTGAFSICKEKTVF